MEFKESVDVLELLLSGEGRRVSAGEILRAGEYVVREVEKALKTGSVSLAVAEGITEEIHRALSLLQEAGRTARGKERAAINSLTSRIEKVWELLEGTARGEDGLTSLEKEGRSPEPLNEPSCDGASAGRSDVKTAGEEVSERGASTSPDEVDVVKLGKRLREKRLKLRLRQQDLARRLRISSSYLSLLENGKCPLPSTAVTERILAFLEQEEEIGPAREGERGDPEAGPDPLAGGKKRCAKSPGRPSGEKGEEKERACLLRELLRTALCMDVEDLRMLVRAAEIMRKDTNDLQLKEIEGD